MSCAGWKESSRAGRSPQSNLTKLLGQRKPHDLPLTLANIMSDVVSGTEPAGHPEIMHHHEGLDFVPGNRSLSAVEVSLLDRLLACSAS